MSVGNWNHAIDVPIRFSFNNMHLHTDNKHHAGMYELNNSSYWYIPWHKTLTHVPQLYLHNNETVGSFFIYRPCMTQATDCIILNFTANPNQVILGKTLLKFHVE